MTDLLISAIILLSPSPMPEVHSPPMEMVASYYGEGDGFHGRKTASGERFDKNALTAAHRKLEFGTKVELENPINGKTVVVTVNDRGPGPKSRDIDVSAKVAEKLGFKDDGVTTLEARIIYEP